MLKNELKYGKYSIYFDSIKSITKINDLIKLMNVISKTNNHNVVFDFTKMRKQSYTSVHVSIAGIAQFYEENMGFTIEFKEKTGMYMAYTETTHPLSVAENNDSLIKNIFDKVLIFSTSEEVAFISDQIINQLKYGYDFENGVLVGLSWCMNEIMDNVFNHSNAPRGYIMAQVHSHKKVVSISIFDTGCGLFKSLSESKEYSPENEEQAIRLAVQKGVTGNREIGQGNGLWGLSKIVEENKGHMSIYTGHTNVIFDFENSKDIVKRNLPILGNENLSTRIDFNFYFENSINLNKALDNYVPFEKINRETEEILMDTGWLDFVVKNESRDGLGTRQAGKSLKRHLLNMAKYDEHPILINFKDIDVITSSFADEFIGKLVSEIGFVQFSSRFRMINLNEIVSALINKAILERK